MIQAADLPAEIRFPLTDSQAKLNEHLAMLELRLIREALEKHNWVQTQAAASLGLSERVMRYKIKKYNLEKP